MYIVGHRVRADRESGLDLKLDWVRVMVRGRCIGFELGLGLGFELGLG